jgi:DNA replication ATP-dependent helicase Dna2
MQTVSEKIENFNILFNLIIEDILFEESEFPIIIFQSEIAQIHNFRIGDTLVLYENQDRESAILHQQVYKSTLISIDENKFHVRLRSRIFSNIKTKQISRWNIEHDLLDKSFLYAYQNIFQFMKLDEVQQGLWLGNIVPKKSKENHRVNYPELDAEFNNILSKIVNSLDYFLLWGPPGTGKTSVIVKYLSHYLVQELGENVLLIAYTNRAVDEMCDAIISHGETWESSYLRIGSRYSVNPRHASNLFESQIRNLKNRKEIQELISSKKIFCATVASILGKKELFNLKQFDTIIIDEASQILEPQLIAWISQFKRIIMIGDHLQLPAVSIQSEQEAMIHDETLCKSGIQNFNQSLFERLYQKYEANGWDHAYAILNRQGRMDNEIMDFVSSTFYKSQLELLPNRSKKQLDSFDSIHSEIHSVLSTQRLIFIDCESFASTSDQKSNEKEAVYITKIISTIKQIYDHNNKTWNADTLGVITPFRVQISTIQKELNASFLSDLPITVDTVERYQGGARDIIILSTSITLAEQLDQICSLSREGVDRKLNVAITRSREQFILIGSKAILYNNKIYKSLIDASYQVKGF